MAKPVSTDAASNLILLESFSLEQTTTMPVQSPVPKGLLIYVLKRNVNKKDSYLVIHGALDEDILSYLADSSPEIYEIILNFLKKESLFLDLKSCKAVNSNGPVDSTEIRSLLQALDTITHFPKRNIDSTGDTGIVSVILAAGKGSRIHSKEIHKVCFPIAGRPAVNRLLDQLESVGIHEHIIVAGEKGKQLVNEITEVRDGVTFVYQINQNGTGNAAKQAAYLLRSQNYNGNILVVLGDKVLKKTALQRLLDDFHNSNADLALMTAKKKMWPDAGRVVFDRKGRPADIVEKRDIQKM
ncbi:MAG TPA: NTP transferase domain-containing protein, partial [Anaerolineae bacterium]|nr:NTP transferase domain-containing protein [Anaerolineae bacterium]